MSLCYETRLYSKVCMECSIACNVVVICVVRLCREVSI